MPCLNTSVIPSQLAPCVMERRVMVWRTFSGVLCCAVCCARAGAQGARVRRLPPHRHARHCRHGRAHGRRAGDVRPRAAAAGHGAAGSGPGGWCSRALERPATAHGGRASGRASAAFKANSSLAGWQQLTHLVNICHHVPWPCHMCAIHRVHPFARTGRSGHMRPEPVQPSAQCPMP